MKKDKSRRRFQRARKDLKPKPERDCNPPEEQAQNSASPYDEEWVVLIKDIGDIDADQIISLLRFYDIPVKKFYKGASQYVAVFTGSTSIGVYLIVKESQYRDAIDILNADVDYDSMY